MKPLFDLTQDAKDNVKLNLALCSFFFSILFGIAGFCVPPMGEINSSVLYLIAQLLVLCATFLGLDGLGLHFLEKKK